MQRKGCCPGQAQFYLQVGKRGEPKGVGPGAQDSPPGMRAWPSPGRAGRRLSGAVADPLTLLFKVLPERILEKLESTERAEPGSGGEAAAEMLTLCPQTTTCAHDRPLLWTATLGQTGPCTRGAESVTDQGTSPQV